MNHHIPYGKQHISEEDIEAVVESLKGDFLTQGPGIGQFEETFARYVDSKYAVAVSNGTAALHLSAMALGVKPGDKVITTPITFAASANCIEYCGGEAIFADIDPETYLLSLQSCRELLEKSSNDIKGIVPVDFAGLPVDMQAFRELADEFNLFLLEDSCHAPGASFEKNNKLNRCGSCESADAAIFSFHPVKHIAAGEGGMITTNDEDLYKKLLALRTHGITKDPSLMVENHGGWYYEMHDLGYNYRLTDIQSALGMSQLQRADKGLSRRREIADIYRKSFAQLPLQMQKVQDGFHHAYHLFVIEIEDRLGLYDFLKENGIFAQVHYIPAHLMPYYRQKGYKNGDFPNAEKYYSRCLSLPMYPSLTDAEQKYVIEKVIEFHDK